MDRLTRDDILDQAAYEEARDGMRRRVMHEKQRRRVHLGDHCTLTFENRDTLRYQIHEMLRTENSWTRPGALEDELTAYNPLIPGVGEVSATLFLEYETPEERAVMLPRFVGIDQHLWLDVGDATPILAAFDRGQIDDGKASAVQYIKWVLNSEQRQLLANEGTVVRTRIDHPVYHAQAVLSEDTRRSLAADAQ